MLHERVYNREKAVAYAKKWALSRNPAYYNFEYFGGDCTNFASQCLYAGSGVMNYRPDIGWYYRNPSDRAPAWSGVRFLYEFLINNKSVGPYALAVEQSKAEIGDLVQLGNADGVFYHTPVIISTDGGEILVAAHTFDAINKPLSEYSYYQARFLHIKGVRSYT